MPCDVIREGASPVSAPEASDRLRCNEDSQPSEDPANHDPGADPSQVLRTQTFPNGTVVSVLRDGTRVQTTKEGVKLVQYATGRTSQINIDGTRIERLEDGTKLQVNPDGSTISLAPDGKRTQISKSGIRIVVNTDGSVVQTNLDGTEIRLNADGTKVQSNPDKSTVSLQSQRGSIRVSETPAPSADPQAGQDPPIGSEVVQHLRIFKSGVRVQVNEAGPWHMQIEEPDGTVMQKGRDGTMLLQDKERCAVYKDGFRSTRWLKDGTETVGVRDEDGEATLRRRFKRFEILVEDKAQDYQQKLLLAERALVTSTQEYERQCHALKERLNTEIQRSERMSMKLEQWREKKQSLASRSSAYDASASFSGGGSFAAAAGTTSVSTGTSMLASSATGTTTDTTPPALPPLPENRESLSSKSFGRASAATGGSAPAGASVSFGLRSGAASTGNVSGSSKSGALALRREEKPVMVTVGTQWKLMDAQSQFFGHGQTKEMREEAESVYKDPELARTVVEELQQRIVMLEAEKQEVEDRLIDLRFSLHESKGSKPSRLARVLPFLFARRSFKQKRRSKEKGALSRHESLLKAVDNLKQREERASQALNKLKRESQSLADEKSTLRKQVEQLSFERDEAVERCTDLQARIDEYLQTEDDPSARRSMEILPCIEEELHMPISLTEVSPMI